MSFSLSLEIAVNGSEQSIIKFLSSIGEVIDEGEASVLLSFPNSGLKCLYKIFAEGRDLTAENIEVTWLVGSIAYFTYAKGSFDLCSTEVRSIINGLCKQFDVNFVLSHEFEKIYAIKNGGNIETMEQY